MDNNDFEYKYSAPTAEERKEIESIRNGYLKEKKIDSKLERLRKLDAKVKNIPLIFGLVFGIFGTLIFGLGMAMVLEWSLMVWGIVVSAVGVVPISLAYPVYKIYSKKMKETYSAEILSLSEQLLNATNNEEK